MVPFPETLFGGDMHSAVVGGREGSETAQEAVREAGELARLFDAPLHVVSAYRATQPAMVTAASAEAGLAFQETDWLVDLRQDVEDRLERTRRWMADSGL